MRYVSHLSLSLSLLFSKLDEENQIKTNHGSNSFLFVEEITNKYRLGIYGALTNW